MLKKILFMALFAMNIVSIWANIETTNLKMYVSFDKDLNPNIALDNAKLRKGDNAKFVAGKSGNAVYFSAKDNPMDLLYNLGNAMQGDRWSIAMWVKLDPMNSIPEQGRYFYRTNLGWNSGNVFAGISKWKRLTFIHLDETKKYCGITMPGASIPNNQWTHLTLVYNKGKHTLLINGNEGMYTTNKDIEGEYIPQTILRIGSFDYKAKDFIEGAIDELKVFDKALSSEEVKEIMETTPGKTELDVVLYTPLDGDANGVGYGSVVANNLVFPKTTKGAGVKVVRYGYDRYSSLSYSDINVKNPKALSYLFYFTPDWDGSNDDATHGLFAINSKDLQMELVKKDKKITLNLTSKSQAHSISLDANVLKKNSQHLVYAAYDFDTKKMILSIDGQNVEGSLTKLPVPEALSPLFVRVGDILATNTYSETQGEGIFDEIIIVNNMSDIASLEELETIQKQKYLKGLGSKLELAPVSKSEEKLWDLAGTERIKSANRELITLNALWRMQLTDTKRLLNSKDWIYSSVPGRYAGQGNGFADCEFFLRDKNLEKIPQQSLYDGSEVRRFVNSWYERAFIVDTSWKGKEIIVNISELSRSQKGTLYLNGEKIADLANAGYDYEILLPESRIKFGEYNFLTIHALDAGGYWNWRGIKGEVSLLIKNKVNLNYPSIVTSVDKKNIQIHTTVKNNSNKEQSLTLVANISGKNAPKNDISSDKIILKAGETKKINISTKWENAELWDHNNPYLYTCNISLKNNNDIVIDELAPIKFGFRSFEVRGRDYYLNNKKIHLFVQDMPVNNHLDMNIVKKSIKQLKSLGYNSIRMNFNTKESNNDNIIKACDELGLYLLVGIEGVTGREYALWSTPETKANLETKMANLIRRWRNHPSNIIYFMSNNYLGYAWDYHPLKMADGYLPAQKQNIAKVCLEAVDIMKKYDNSRPYFFQAGGNFSQIITNNSYFCWWPQTERNAWPEEWSKIGQKPLMVIETSFPYRRSFYGMDLYNKGNKPLFFYENLARYYGPNIYKKLDETMNNMVEKSTKGQYGSLWHDDANFQQLKYDLIKDTLKYWRGFNMSGISLFEEVILSYEGNSPKHTRFDATKWELNPTEFRKFGTTPDIHKYMYQADMGFDKPLKSAMAIEDSLAPRFAFIDGGEKSPVDKTHNYYEEAKLDKRIVLINDTLTTQEFKGKWTFGDKTQSFSKSLEPGAIDYIPVKLTMPRVKEITIMVLSVDIDKVKKPESLNISVYPRSQSNIPKIALYDPKGYTTKKLESFKQSFSELKNLKNLNDIKLIIIGCESLNEEFMTEVKRLNIREALLKGDLNILIMAQQPEALKLLNLRTMPIYARDIFDANGEKYGQWAGLSTLSPHKALPSATSEFNFPSPLWHWNNSNTVSSYPILRPTEGDYEIMLSCGKDLIYTPLFSMKSGLGNVIFAQLDIEKRTQEDPEADKMFVSLLEKYAKLNIKTATREVINYGSKQEILDQVIQGAYAVLPANMAKEFGLNLSTKTINSFDITDEGKQYFGTLSARDTYLRSKQIVTVMSGENVVALTTPALIVEKSFGKGKIMFIGFPENPQAAELELGKKQGVASSNLWSAEILVNRFNQLTDMAMYAYGKKASQIMAELLANMNVPEVKVDLNYEWDFITPEGQKLKCKVPGYYNFQHAALGKKAGIYTYKTQVKLPKNMQNTDLYLEIGAIDDLDKSYVNGVLIGQTGKDTTGYWQAQRYYLIPKNLTQNGVLNIEIRVENLLGNGGILGYAKIVKGEKSTSKNAFPYSNNKATYNTETHIRW